MGFKVMVYLFWGYIFYVIIFNYNIWLGMELLFFFKSDFKFVWKIYGYVEFW